MSASLAEAICWSGSAKSRLLGVGASVRALAAAEIEVCAKAAPSRSKPVPFSTSRVAMASTTSGSRRAKRGNFIWALTAKRGRC